MKSRVHISLALCTVLVAAATAGAVEITVTNSAELTSAIHSLTPGTTVLIEPGTYDGGNFLDQAQGTASDPIIIRGSDPDNPPVFSGGGVVAMLISSAEYLTLSDLRIEGYSGNGLNIDHGGSFATPSHHITLNNLAILDTGPTGNHDGLKMSGVNDFVVRRCHFEGWGGSGIDIGACTNGVVEDCTFIGKDGFSQWRGINAKGGSENVLIQTSYFLNAGARAVEIGGSTDLIYFPPGGCDFEARHITVGGNRIVGSDAPVAWVTADGGRVHHNTMVLPEAWAARILQESSNPQFLPCHDGRFEHNLIVFDDQLSSYSAVNVGTGTAPETFVFHHNAWYDLTGGGRDPVLRDLPPETDGVYDADPELIDFGLPTMRIGSSDPQFDNIGADAYVRPVPEPGVGVLLSLGGLLARFLRGRR